MTYLDDDESACEVRMHEHADSFFANCCSDMLMGAGRLAPHQMLVGSATNPDLEVVGSGGLPAEARKGGEMHVKQLFSFHLPSGRACGALALAPAAPTDTREFRATTAGEMSEGLVARALSMADPRVVQRLRAVVGPPAVGEAVAAALLGARPALRRGPLGKTVAAMEHGGSALPPTLQPVGCMRRMALDGLAYHGRVLCEEREIADEALLETTAVWQQGFWRDVFGAAKSREGARRIAEDLAAKGTMYLWSVGGVGPVAGAVIGRWLADVGCSLTFVYTPPEHRRRGYAQALLASMSEALAHMGMRVCLFADVHGSHGAARLYERLGFTDHGTLVDMKFVEGSDAVVKAKGEDK